MIEMNRERATVLGGGMAGLLAARVLADEYENVTIIDRDPLDVGESGRRGVPQGRHAHLLLARGLLVLDDLFPGFADALVAAGATSGDAVGDARLCFGGHRFAQAHAGLRMVSVSRPFLEHHVRTRVLSRPNVTVVPPSDIVGLTAADAGTVTGVHVFRRADGSVGERLPSDLVVDATGRGSRAPTWLADLGFERPTEERAGVDVSYSSCNYRLPADALGDDWGCLVAPTRTSPRGAALARLEHGRWLLTLVGVDGVRPPTDPAALAIFARSLPFPDVADAIGAADPIDDPVAYRFPRNVRRRYERLSRLPAGFVVLGDGVCSFNPIYAQGMTVAALEAVALRDHLRRHRVPVPLELQRAVARVVDTPWEMALGGDLDFPGAHGRLTRKLRMLGRYLARLHAAAAHDPSLAAAFMRAAGLMDRPEALMRPSVLFRVLRRSTTGDGPTPVPIGGGRS